MNLRVLQVRQGATVIEVSKAAPAHTPDMLVDEDIKAFIREMEALFGAVTTAGETASFMERTMAPRDEVMKAAGEAYQSYAADQPSGGMPAGIGAGAPTPSVPQNVQISATGTVTSTPSVPEDKTIAFDGVNGVDDLRRQNTPDAQVFVPYAVRAANDLRKARRNAARSRGFSNPLDIAKDEEADFIEQMETLFAELGRR